ncbi:ATP-binding protein [Paracoccus benzoatiresistens]|uniref:ATP-binding protein n=1 Tax=Paracoccus benzoatiresistens TaxID=2997341 RepID=A0ABT4J5X9_9RHOB|nr:ATP-binding protein [Paracoccus sp. EF6]MCZ0961856.1 ATP-binding protein [Paracoccus sp. EF6]
MESRGFHVECGLESVDATMAAVCAFVGDTLSPEGLIRLEIAVTEALNNVVLHGGLPQGAGIAVAVRKAAPEVGPEVGVEIRDPGQPVPAELFKAARNPADIDPLEESGRGIPLIVAMSDALHYESRDGSNCLTLRFADRSS